MEELRRKVEELRRKIGKLRRSTEAGLEKCGGETRVWREEWREWRNEVEEMLEDVVEWRKGQEKRYKEDKKERNCKGVQRKVTG